MSSCFKTLEHCQKLADANFHVDTEVRAVLKLVFVFRPRAVVQLADFHPFFVFLDVEGAASRFHDASCATNGDSVSDKFPGDVVEEAG